MNHLDRVIQVVGRDPADSAGPFFVASGVLLADDLALTAAHAVQEATDGVPGGVRYEVRPSAGAGKPLRVSRVVPHPGRDLALLVLDPDGAAPEPLGPPLRFAELPHTIGQIEVHAVGFPRFAVEGSGPRSHQIDATVQLGSDRTGRQLQLSVLSSDPPPAAPGRSPWSGFSGAGVLTKAEGLLAGIVTSHRPSGDRRTTTATDLTGLDDPAFLAVLAAHGVDPAPIPVHPPAPGTPHWLPHPVRTVLARQQAEADELPHRFRQDRRPRRLTAVYVRQVLNAWENSPEGPGGRPEGAEHPGRVAQSAGPPRRLADILGDESGHVLVEAGPGAGKSTLLHRCALEYGRAALAAGSGRGCLVPLWVTAAELADPAHSLEAAVAAATGLDTGTGTLPRLPAGARWLVLVDALDEVHHHRRDRLIHRLADHAAQAAGPLRLLVTTRPDPEATAELARAGFQRYLLAPFDRHGLEEFARSWFRDAGPGTLAADFLRQIDDSGLADLLRNPLLATVTAVVFENAPDRPLPDNRWGLYEQYRLHLRATKGRQAERMWRELEDGCAGARARRAVATLRDRLDELLGRLAHAQLTEDVRDLPGAAHRWWEETATDDEGHRFGAVAPVDGWADAITEALLSTGLFVRQGRDLAFLHTTFAEHMAAELLADELPDSFDLGARAWRTAIVTASGRTEHPQRDLYLTALVHYCHRHRQGGRSLLDWLQQGPLTDQMLAAELLAARCPAEGVHYRHVVQAVRREPGLASRGRVWDLLSRMRDPQVRALLDDTAHREGPWRAEATFALVEHDAGSAARALAHSADSADARLLWLAGTAYALAEAHPAYRDTAADVLRTVLAHPRADLWDRADTANLLATLGDEYLHEGAGVLVDLINEARPEVLGFDKAVRHLLEIGGGYTDQVARRYALLAADPLLSDHRQHTWVEKLIALGEPYYPLAAERLSSVIRDPLTHTLMRLEAARTLAGLGPPYRERAAQALRGFITEAVSAHHRHEAVDQLARLGAPFTGEAAQMLSAMSANPGVPASWRARSAGLLTGLGPEYTDQAERAWRALLDDRAVGPGLKAEAAAGLRRLKERAAQPATAPPPGQAIGMLEHATTRVARRTLGNRRSSPALRLSAAKGLAALGEPPFDAEAAEALLTVLIDRDSPPGSQADAANVLLQLGEPHLDHAGRRLRARFAAAADTSPDRSAAARALLALGLLDPRKDFEPLCVLLVDTPGDSFSWEKLHTLLPAPDESPVPELVRVLRHTLTGADARRRHTAAASLRLLGWSHLSSVATDLDKEATDAASTGEQRLNAARALLALNGPCIPVDTDVLRAVAADRRSSTGERLRAVDILLCLDRGYTGTAAKLLFSVARRRTTGHEDFLLAVTLLVLLGDPHLHLAVRALRSATVRWRHGPDAARTLAALGAPYDKAAADCVRRSARRWWAGIGQQLAKAYFLSEMTDHVPDAARVLRRVVRRPWTAMSLRALAVTELAHLPGPYRAVAADALTSARFTRLSPSQRRVEVAGCLLGLGKEYHSRAVAVLLGVITSPFTESVAMRNAVVSLWHLGEEYREPTLRALRTASARRGLFRSRWFERQEAAEMLAALGAPPPAASTGPAGPTARP
ncbi:trypsin-like peptidase domain-containing protein [Streptomyces sp. NPDC052721]|uniref:trypsin-like peptidase domain-containing protein n=1 Tax=Streptomyces sp. NPDC052721 TaxID=3154955 RepID=UPI003438A898